MNNEIEQLTDDERDMVSEIRSGRDVFDEDAAAVAKALRIIDAQTTLIKRLRADLTTSCLNARAVTCSANRFQKERDALHSAMEHAQDRIAYLEQALEEVGRK